MKRRELFKHAARFALGAAGAKPVVDLLREEIVDAEETACAIEEGREVARFGSNVTTFAGCTVVTVNNTEYWLTVYDAP